MKTTETTRRFDAVAWLPTYYLTPETLHGTLEVIMPAESKTPYSRVEIRPDMTVTRRQARNGIGVRDVMTLAQTQKALAQTTHEPDSPERRIGRTNLAHAIAETLIEQSLTRIGTMRDWLIWARAERLRFLSRVDDGRPLSARATMMMQRKVPNCLQHMGACLPTSEMVETLRDLGPVHEMGAGFGLVSRALLCAGADVSATDSGASDQSSLAFPVERGVDAATAMTDATLMRGRPTILVTGPDFKDEPWIHHAFEKAAPGQFVALASPEFDLASDAHLDDLPRTVTEKIGPGWPAAVELKRRIAADFERIAEPPMIGAGWPMVTTPLRIWRRRTTH